MRSGRQNPAILARLASFLVLISRVVPDSAIRFPPGKGVAGPPAPFRKNRTQAIPHHRALPGAEPHGSVAYMEAMWRTVLIVALFPAIAAGQITPRTPVLPIGQPRSPADTTHHGVFLEVMGAGGLYTLSYERKLQPDLMTQVGFTKWSMKGLGPKRAKTAAVASLLRQFHLFDWVNRDATLETGGGFVAGRHLYEVEPHPPDTTDVIGPAFTLQKSAYVALTGLLGVRLNGERNHDISVRVGVVPTLVLKDVPAAANRLRAVLALSAGYTW